MNSTGLFGVLLAVLLGGAAAIAFFRAEGAAPSVEGPEALAVGRSGASVRFSLADEGSGLRGARAALVHPGGEVVLLEEGYPGNLMSGGVRSQHDVEVALDPGRLDGFEGEAVLRVAVRDWSWRGNETVRDVPVRVDLDPPRLAVATGLTYARQGGSGAVEYRISEPTSRDGVRVGEHFYHGFPKPGGATGERVAIFAVSPDGPGVPTVLVVAEDEAGNAAEARWPLVVKARPLPDASVTLSRAFLEKIMPRFTGNGVGEDPATAFDDVNTRVRAESEARIREALSESASQPLFEGGMEQQRNSKVTSRFGERRTYFFDGRQVSRATHYGYDLASTAGAPITAAAGGRVAFADDLGIYGNCVLIDHGLGLATLYGHLSSVEVSEGDTVTKGQKLGRSGDTGLAGGDHLHFAVLVGGTYVDPIEWWDPEWVRTHVENRWRSPGG